MPSLHHVICKAFNVVVACVMLFVMSCVAIEMHHFGVMKRKRFVTVFVGMWVVDSLYCTTFANGDFSRGVISR